MDSGISLQAVKELGPLFPLFGVCMGHQCIGEAFGGEYFTSELLPRLSVIAYESLVRTNWALQDHRQLRTSAQSVATTVDRSSTFLANCLCQQWPKPGQCTHTHGACLEQCISYTVDRWTSGAELLAQIPMGDRICSIVQQPASPWHAVLQSRWYGTRQLAPSLWCR